MRTGEHGGSDRFRAVRRRRERILRPRPGQRRRRAGGDQRRHDRPDHAGASLSTDTGISPTDRITSATTQTLTITFSERTVWSPSDILITAPDNSVVTPISAHGTGTNTLTLVLPTLAQNGTYSVTLGSASTFTDQAGNALANGAPQTVTFTIDTVSPSVIGSAAFSYQTQQSLSYLLSEDLSLTLEPTDLVLTNLTTGTTIDDSLASLAFGAVPPGEQSAHFTFANLPGHLLPDGNYTTTLATGVTDPAGNPLSPVGTDSFFVLSGDANHDRTVDTTDFVALANHFNASNPNFSQGDFNYDGKVNALDFNILATQFGKTLAAPSPAPPPLEITQALGLAGTTPPNLFSDRPVQPLSSLELQFT